MQSIGFDTYTNNVMTSIPNELKLMVKSQAHTRTGSTVYRSFGLLCTRLTKPSCVFNEHQLKRETQKTKGQGEE